MFAIRGLRAALVAGLYVLACVPLVVSPQTYFPFTFGKAIVIRLVAALLAIVWAALVCVDPRATPRRTAIMTALGLYGAASALSALASVDQYRSIVGNAERMGGLLALVAYGMVYLAARAAFPDRRDWVRFAKVAIAVGVIEGAYAVAQRAGAGFVWLPNARPGGTFGNAAMLAGHMVFVAGFGALVLNESDRIVWRIYGGTAIAWAGLVIAVTGARGAALGVYMALVLIAVALTLSSPDSRLRARAAIGGIVLVVAPIVLLLTPVGSWAGRHGMPALGRFREVPYDDQSTQVRVQLARIAWHAFRERPLTGWGLENFRVPFNRYFEPEWLKYSPTELADKPHNTPLEVAAESGAVGLLGYVSVLAAVVAAIRRSTKRASSERERWTLLILAGLWCAYFVNNLFIFDTPVSLLMAALALAMTDCVTRVAPDKARAAVGIRVPGAMAVVVVVAIGQVVYNARAWGASTRGRAATHLTAPDRVVSELEAALREGTYAAEVLRRVLAGPVLERFAKRGDESYARYVGVAIRELESSSGRDALDPRLRGRLGELYNSQGSADPANYDRAATVLRQALALAPNLPELHFALAGSYRGQGRDAEAVRAFTTGMALTPPSAQPRYDDVGAKN